MSPRPTNHRAVQRQSDSDLPTKEKRRSETAAHALEGRASARPRRGEARRSETFDASLNS